MSLIHQQYNTLTIALEFPKRILQFSDQCAVLTDRFQADSMRKLSTHITLAKSSHFEVRDPKASLG